MTTSEKKLVARAVGLGFGCLLGALGVMWYNHVWFQKPIAFWQCFVISIALCLAGWTFKPLHKVIGVIFAVSIIAQALVWCGFFKLPLIHL